MILYNMYSIKILPIDNDCMQRSFHILFLHPLLQLKSKTRDMVASSNVIQSSHKFLMRFLVQKVPHFTWVAKIPLLQHYFNFPSRTFSKFFIFPPLWVGNILQCLLTQFFIWLFLQVGLLVLVIFQPGMIIMYCTSRILCPCMVRTKPTVIWGPEGQLVSKIWKKPVAFVEDYCRVLY